MPSIIIGPDSRVLFWNAAAERLFGWSSEEVVGRTLPSVPQERLDEHLRIRQRALDGEGFSQQRITRLAKDGTPIEVSLSTWPIRRANGSVTAIIGIFADIGAEELRDSEERFRRMVEVAAEGIWIVDIKGNTAFVNNRMAALLGYTKEEMLGRLCFDFLDPEEHERALRDFAASRKCDIGPQEYRLRHKNGSIVWLDITGTAMFDDTGRLTGILAMCSDVTQRKANEQRLRQAQRLESLGILAAGVAHDFNNLLTGIMGNASLILETTQPGSRSRTMLQEVITASERAAQLTRELLTYAGRDQGKLQPLDMAVVTRELVPLLTASIPNTVRLSFELADGAPLVQADSAQLQQVMMNLVINAAESIPERTLGEVKVGVGRHSLQPEDHRDAVVPIEADDHEYVSFSVTDNGRGMDPATRARIFDPFFSTKFHGRGLGLSAVLGIVKGHGGTLTVRTALERGSVFTVLLPASRAARARGDTHGVIAWNGYDRYRHDSVRG